MTTWEDRTLIEDILAQGRDDWIHPVDVTNIARRVDGVDAESLTALSLGIVAEVLFRGLMIPGDAAERGFEQWDTPISVSFERIVLQWLEVGTPDLRPGDIVWLANTDAGDEIGRSVLKREELR